MVIIEDRLQALLKRKCYRILNFRKHTHRRVASSCGMYMITFFPFDSTSTTTVPFLQSTFFSSAFLNVSLIFALISSSLNERMVLLPFLVLKRVFILLPNGSSSNTKDEEPFPLLHGHFGSHLSSGWDLCFQRAPLTDYSWKV